MYIYNICICVYVYMYVYTVHIIYGMFHKYI